MGLSNQVLEVRKRGSYDAFSHLGNGYDAFGFQSSSVLAWLYNHRGLFLFDPGMGKTFTIALAILALKSQLPSRKVLFFICKNQMHQTAEDIRWYTGLDVLVASGEKDSLIAAFSRMRECDVMMITYESLRSLTGQSYLLNLIGEFSVCVADEVQRMTNLEHSDNVFLFSSILTRMDYVAFLTATPFLTKSSQYASLLNLMDPETFSSPRELEEDLNHGICLDEEYPLSIYSYSRSDLQLENNYITHVQWVEPMEWQTDVPSRSKSLLVTMTGRGCENQRSKLVETLLKEKVRKRKGLVYVYYHDTLAWLKEEFNAQGLRYGCINGDVDLNERTQVQYDFVDGKLDFVVLSVATALNLDADYVYFYQYNFEFKQVLGRAERGLSPKIIDLYFLLTKETAHAEHFLRTVYMLSRLVRSWIGREYSEFLSVGKEVVEYVGGVTKYESD